MEFIFNLETEDFIDIVLKAFERHNNEQELRMEEMLLHQWGYQLFPLMEEPMSFEQYKSESMGAPRNPEKAKPSKGNNERLMNEIDRLKELDQRFHYEVGDKQ